MLNAGRRFVIAGAAGLALASLVGVVVASAGSTGRGPAVRAAARVNFVSVCRFSHRSTDDPIVYPDHPGLSHDHSFVGNTTTDAFSTLQSLLAGGTTCQRPNDTAGYWMPTLLVAGQPLAPLSATIYYRRRTRARVTPFPTGLKMIAGDAHAMSPQSQRITFWNCGAETGVPPSSAVPTCPTMRGSGLRLHVSFPSCWDGTNLDSADHKSHMAYPERGACPADHPVAVPAISLIYRYPTAGGPDVELASMGQYSGHADFFNAWNERALTRLVNRCLNGLRHCGRGNGAALG
jgi:uncharacterized protein DUF1996